MLFLINSAVCSVARILNFIEFMSEIGESIFSLFFCPPIVIKADPESGKLYPAAS